VFNKFPCEVTEENILFLLCKSNVSLHIHHIKDRSLYQLACSMARPCAGTETLTVFPFRSKIFHEHTFH